MANRVVLGNIGSGDYGLLISRPGVNALTANADQLIFDTRTAGFGQLIYKETVTCTRGTANTEHFLVKQYLIQ